jgi:hypothetical protein
MKLLKVLTALLAVGAATTAVAQPYTASQEQQRLISLGLSPELAREVTDFLDGDGIYQPLAPRSVPTMAATPVAGVNVFSPGVNVVPTAAANTAALLPATPVPGQVFTIINNGPNAVRVKAGGAAAINGGAAGNYISVATLQQAECVTIGAAAHNCALKTVPTPAGP